MHFLNLFPITADLESKFKFFLHLKYEYPYFIDNVTFLLSLGGIKRASPGEAASVSLPTLY